MGGALLQQLNRDTQKFAMKCSHIWRGTESVDVFKDPVTDHGKVSKAGRLDLVRDSAGNYHTVALGKDEVIHKLSEMKVVFENGEVVKEYTLDEVRARAKGTV